MGDHMMSDNGWVEWKNHVLLELQQVRKAQEQLSKDISDIRVEIGQLKIKSGLWGAIAGCIPFIVALIIYVLKSIV